MGGVRRPRSPQKRLRLPAAGCWLLAADTIAPQPGMSCQQTAGCNATPSRQSASPRPAFPACIVPTSALPVLREARICTLSQMRLRGCWTDTWNARSGRNLPAPSKAAKLRMSVARLEALLPPPTHVFATGACLCRGTTSSNVTRPANPLRYVQS